MIERKERIGREILAAIRRLPEHRGGPVQVRRLLADWVLEEEREPEEWVSVALGLERAGRLVIERETRVGEFVAPVLRLPVAWSLSKVEG